MSDNRSGKETSLFYSKTLLKSDFQLSVEKQLVLYIYTLHDWLKKLVPLLQPIRRETKTNPSSLAHVFPRFASVTCFYLVLIGSLDYL